MPEIQTSAQIAVSKTFVMAHLLTANIDQAETACREALDAWNPEVEADEALLRYGAAAALRTRPGPCPTRLDNSLSGGSYLPAELQAVLKLPQPLRPCFALRMLGGFSAADCAQLLGLRSSDIDKYTRSAVIRLATLNRQELKEGLMDQDTDYEAIEHLAYQLWLERGSPIGSPGEDWFRAEVALHGDRIDEMPGNPHAAAATDSSGSLNSFSMLIQKMGFSVAELGYTDGIVTLQITGVQLYDATNGLVTMTIITPITGICQ